MTARAAFEATAWAAWRKYRQAIADQTPCPCKACREPGTYRTPADYALLDTLLRAADVYAHGAASMRRRSQVRAL